MFRILKSVGGKLSLAAAGVAIIVGLVCHLIGSRSVAFADVLEKASSVHTVRYTATIQMPAGPVPAQEIQFIELDNGRERCTLPGEIAIHSQGKSLILNTSEKTAVVITNTSAGQKELPAPTSPSFLAMIKRLRDASYENLGKKEIDGKSAAGFRARKNGMDWTIWVDQKTELPVRVELTYSGIHTLMSNFVFNEPIDESLFSLTPPAGYKVSEKAPLAGHAVDENELVKGLRAVTVIMLGHFPSEFNMAAIIKEAAPLRSKGVKVDWSGSGMTRDDAGLALMLGITFVTQMKPDNDWHYAAKDVKVGDASKALCWWRPDGAKTYRVVYGDFSVRDCSPSDLPTAPSK